MNQEVRDELVTALRSGEFKQGKYRLRKSNRYFETPDEYCCLGVLCELAVQHNIIPPALLDGMSGDYTYGAGEDVSSVALPGSVRDWAGLETDSPSALLPTSNHPWDDRESLVGMNDGDVPFDRIADLIENLEVS